MPRRLVGITLDNLSDLPSRCRTCVYWELDAAAGRRACETGDPGLEKEAWVSDTLLQWGTCGQLAYVDDVPAGYVLYAPPAYVPRSAGFATSPASPDAVLLMTGRIDPSHVGSGLGAVMVQAVARDVVRRGIRAIEVFGRTGPQQAAAQAGDRPGDRFDCLLPADFLQAVGFKTVRAHPHTPRLRLDVRSMVTWREDVEYAFDRLLASIQSPVLSR